MNLKEEYNKKHYKKGVMKAILPWEHLADHGAIQGLEEALWAAQATTGDSSQPHSPWESHSTKCVAWKTATGHTETSSLGRSEGLSCSLGVTHSSSVGGVKTR